MTEINNIYDTANQLERDLRALPAYLELKADLEAIQADEEASKLFNEFRDMTKQMQEKQMQGQEPSEADMTGLQELSQKVSANDLIMKLMQSEQAVSQTINDINDIIMKPLSDIYK
ncbi:YlbF family regulator [Eremococcus coleocola]|uniref:UPF0342 protein HMPREF9257_1684 n=1 Tax=Eremococcus coleocola ACS-139-V-Col8 TaxID=908337 RepID=E4KQ84_9LACT|nr:YlbF family regulator [Eremococcus coleocola]EFR30858.1 hypothetical protein HMPREF9257_1684 [Eremococcus coleocola ACS-139-V-Col8]